MSRRALAVVALLLLGACGLPEDESYRPIPEADVPFGLQETTTTTTTTTTLPPATTTTIRPPSTTTTTTIPLELVNVYFVDGTRLAVVLRELVRPASPTEALVALSEGPDLGTDPVGLRSSIPEGLILTVEVSGGTATVDLTPDLVDLAGTEQLLALAQIVATLTDRPGIGRVSFTLEGRPIDVPRADGTVSQGSVSRDDYASLLPEPPA